MTKLGDLSNDELVARLRAHVGRGNEWLVGLLVYLGEVDARRLYAEHACPSMWDFCVRRLGMSEGEANRRIAAARVVRRFPLARGYLERGEVHLCAVYEMHKHLTDENHEGLLREASGKSTKAVAEMIAARFPRPDVLPSIEPLAPQPALAIATTEMSLSGAAVAPERLAPVMPRPRIEPLSATRYRVELTVSAETKAKLERIKDLMCHRNPSGDLEKIFDASLDLLLVKLERERLGKTVLSRMKKDSAMTDRVANVDATAKEVTDATEAKEANEAKEAKGKTQQTRGHIPTAVRRAVFARDGEQCTYVDAAGNRCPARGYLELDHVHAKALGGSDDAANLRARCFRHNQWHAEQVFGRAYIEEQIHVRRRKCARSSAPPAPSSFEAVTRGLRTLGFRESEVRAAMGRLQTTLDPALSDETILREALKLLT